MTLLIIVALISLFAATITIWRVVRDPDSSSHHLCMAVWAAFGPYKTASNAADMLRQVARVVFGSELPAHQQWIDDHIQNFTDWEANGDLANGLGMMRRWLLKSARGRPFQEAYATVRQEIIDEGVAVLNELTEPAGYAWEPVKQPDGTVGLLGKQLWSDEEIQRKQRADDEQIRDAVGAAILKAESDAASKLLNLLRDVHRHIMGKEIETPADAGVAYHLCLELANKKPESEGSKEFRRLERDWLESATART